MRDWTALPLMALAACQSGVPRSPDQSVRTGSPILTFTPSPAPQSCVSAPPPPGSCQHSAGQLVTGPLPGIRIFRKCPFRGEYSFEHAGTRAASEPEVAALLTRHMEAMMNLRPAGNPVRQVSLAGGGVEILYSASTTVDVSSLAARFGRKDGVPGAPDWGGLEPFARRPDIDTTEIAESLRQMFEDEGDLCFVTSLTPGAVAVYED